MIPDAQGLNLHGLTYISRARPETTDGWVDPIQSLPVRRVGRLKLSGIGHCLRQVGARNSFNRLAERLATAR
jgi:hypothetical protein